MPSAAFMDARDQAIVILRLLTASTAMLPPSTFSGMPWYTSSTPSRPSMALMGAIKRAENDVGRGLRTAETAGDARTVRIDLKLIGRSAAVEPGGYEIKTLYFADDNSPVREILITETDL